MLDTLTLDQLRLFLTVAESGSFSAAGRRLGRVQSAVGYGISKLEEALGVCLFERSGRCVSLTDAGRALLPEAEAVFEQVGKLRQRADRLESRVEPQVTVALEAMLPGEFVVGLCSRFKARFPQVSLHLRTEGLGGVSDVVCEEACDLGISGDYDLRPNLHQSLLGHLPVVAVVSASHPLATERGPLSRQRMRQESQIVIAHSRYGSGRSRSILSDTLLSVAGGGIKIDLILGGFGWGFVPRASVDEALASGALVTLDLKEGGPGPQGLGMYLITRRDAQLGPAGQWLHDHLAEAGLDAPLSDAA